MLQGKKIKIEIIKLGGLVLFFCLFTSLAFAADTTRPTGSIKINNGSLDKKIEPFSHTGKHINSIHQPLEIRKTNIKDTKFTISWRTIKKTTGQIKYGETPSTEQIAFDDRRKGILSKIHHVTIRNLKPNTVYYYKIVSANKAYQNNNKPFTITTGPSIMATGSDVAYGRIYSRKNIPYKKVTIVYLTLYDKDGAGSQGASSPVSVLTDINGYWSYELKNFRGENLNNLFIYSEAGDRLKIGVQAEELPDILLLEVDTKDDSPVKNIIMR